MSPTPAQLRYWNRNKVTSHTQPGAVGPVPTAERSRLRSTAPGTLSEITPRLTQEQRDALLRRMRGG